MPRVKSDRLLEIALHCGLPLSALQIDRRNSSLAHRCRLAYATCGLWEVLFMVIQPEPTSIVAIQSDPPIFPARTSATQRYGNHFITLQCGHHPTLPVIPAIYSLAKEWRLRRGLES
jgi:hypothetical protein